MEPNVPTPSVLIDPTPDEETLEQPMATSHVDGTLEQPVPLSDDEDGSDDSWFSFDDEVDGPSSLPEEGVSQFIPGFIFIGNCRICLAPELDEASDPMIAVGCKCKRHLSIGHQSCLKRGQLGALLKQIILTYDGFGERVFPRVNPQVLFLLRVPPEDLDRLEVPMDTPEFSALPPQTQVVVGDLLRRLENPYPEQIRRGEIQEVGMFRGMFRGMFHALHGDVAGSQIMGDGDLPSTSITRASQLLIDHFIVMQYVSVGMENAGDLPVHACIPRHAGPADADDMNIRIRMDEVLRPEDRAGELPRRGEMLRVPIDQQGQGGQAPDVEALLDELAVLADLIANDDPHMVLLPRSMVVENILINRAPNNITGGGPVLPLAQQGAPPACRQFTYGRYGRISVFRFYQVQYASVDFSDILDSP